MGRTARKHRKNRDYEHIPEPKKTVASPYDIRVGKETQHIESDLLSSPREFVALDQLAAGDAAPFTVVMTMMATCVGANVLVMPFAFLQGGFAMTIFMTLFLAWTTHVSRTRLVELGVDNGIYSLQGLTKLAFGPRGAYFVGLSQLIASLGLIIAYLDVVFRDIPIVLGHWFSMDFDIDGHPIVSPTSKTPFLLKILADRFWFAELFNLVILIPLCLYTSSYRRVRVSSTFVTIILAVTACSVIAKARSMHKLNLSTTSQGYTRDYLTVPSTVCQAFGILGTVFASQHHAFHNFYALRDRTSEVFTRLSLVSILGSVILALSIGIGGYVSFLGATKPDVLQNYDFVTDRKLLPYWVLVPMAAMICVTHEVIVSRHTMQFLFRSTSSHESDDVLFDSQNASKIMLDHQHSLEEEPVAWVSHLLTTIVLIVIGQVSTFYVDNIATVLGVTGGLSGLALCFIFPALCQLRLTPSDRPRHWWRDVTWPILSVFIGLGASTACIVSIVVHAHMKSNDATV